MFVIVLFHIKHNILILCLGLPNISANHFSNTLHKVVIARNDIEKQLPVAWMFCSYYSPGNRCSKCEVMTLETADGKV